MSERPGFLKQHGFLIAGVALPLLVVVAFVLSRTLPRLWVDDPKYDVLYGLRAYSGPAGTLDLAVTVVDGHLRARWTRTKEPTYAAPLRVFRRRAATGQIDPIPIPEPGPLPEPGDTADVLVPGLDGFRVDASPRAPDGYEFSTLSMHSTGFVNEIFGRGYEPARAGIEKGGRVLVFPRDDGGSYAYEPAHFLGWLIPEGTGR